MGLDELREKLNRVASAQEAPFIKLEDAEGRFHLINVAQIVAINGPQ